MAFANGNWKVWVDVLKAPELNRVLSPVRNWVFRGLTEGVESEYESGKKTEKSKRTI